MTFFRENNNKYVGP